MTENQIASKIFVLLGDTWGEGPDRRHKRHYIIRTEEKDPDTLAQSRVFEGMDNVSIDEEAGTEVKACWSDVSGNPAAVERLVGPKGLRFLKLIEEKRIERWYATNTSKGRHRLKKLLFAELTVVSAWQFNITVPSRIFSTEVDNVILPALEEHLGKSLEKKKWKIG